MFSNKALVQIFDRALILKLLLWGLLFSLIPLGEVVLLIYLAGRMGSFFIPALAGSISFLGFFICYQELKTAGSAVMAKVTEGQYPEKEFAMFAGSFVCALLFLSIGFVTDLLAIFLLFPSLRSVVGRLFTERSRNRLKELYEYLKLYQV
ncbi:MAG: FxsA family protein [Spirochaetia bacterium]